MHPHLHISAASEHMAELRRSAAERRGPATSMPALRLPRLRLPRRPLGGLRPRPV